MNIGQLFVRLKAMGLKPFSISKLPGADDVKDDDLIPFLSKGEGPIGYAKWRVIIGPAINGLQPVAVSRLQFREVPGVEQINNNGSGTGSGATNGTNYNDPLQSTGLQISNSSPATPITVEYTFDEPVIIRQIYFAVNTLARRTSKIIVEFHNGAEWEELQTFTFVAGDYSTMGGVSNSLLMELEAPEPLPDIEKTISVGRFVDHAAASGKLVPDVITTNAAQIQRKLGGNWQSITLTGASLASTVPARTGASNGGTLRAGDALVDDDLVTLRQFNAKFAAVNALDPATATLEELITALQTPAAPAALNMIVEEDETL